MKDIVSSYLLALMFARVQRVSPLSGVHFELSTIAGKDIFIPCVPKPSNQQVELRVDNRRIEHSTYFRNEGFTVYNVTKDQDGKLYRCYFTNEQDSEEFIGCWHLQVSDYRPLQKPEIDQGPVSHVVWGNILRLVCQITQLEGIWSSLSWRVPESVAAERYSYNTEPILVAGGTVIKKSVLTVKNVQKTDDGHYICVATYFNIEDQSSTTVKIHDPDPLEKPVIKEETPFHTIRGSDLKLSCQITVPRGDNFSLGWKVPSPDVMNRTTENKVQIFLGNDTGTRESWRTELTLKEVARSDRGEYICVAEGLVNNITSSIEVQIWEPRNITGGRVVRAKLNETATLSCYVDGYSLTNFSWVKINDPEGIGHSGIESRNLYPNNTSVAMCLNFTSITRDNNGTYECSAEDYNGIITNETSLIVLEKPEVTIEKVKVFGGDSVYLKWKIYDGNDHIKMNLIQLMKKGSDRWEDYPEKLSNDISAYVLEDLEKGAEYRFRITVENGIGASEPADSQWITTPEDAVEPVFNPKVEYQQSETSIKVRWTELPAALKDLIQYYELQALLEGKVNRSKILPVTQTSYEFIDLIAGVKYEINILACNNDTERCITTSKSDNAQDEREHQMYFEMRQVGIWSGYGVAILVFVIMAVLLCIRKQRDLASRKRFMEATLVRFRAGAMNALNPNLDVADQSELLPYNKKWEFPKKQLTLGKVLGSGAFGIVRKGQARSIRRKNSITTVAVKMVRATHRLDHMTALTRELKILAHLGKHLNIVNLLGACTKNLSYGELLVIVEFCRFGNLRDYLLLRRDNFVDQVDFTTGNIADSSLGTDNVEAIDSGIDTVHLCSSMVIGDCENSMDSKCATVNIDDPTPDDDYIKLDQDEPCHGDFTDQDLKPIGTRDLLSWAWQVSRGMKYLTSRRVLHGDLAARNILLADRKVVKICDFGLAKSLYSDDIYKKEGRGPLPVKWMAIESIRDRVFSFKSDVWSFGVVLWEFFTLAETPYPGIENENVFRKLIDGFRMERPKYATEEIYNMMLRCWDAEPSERPSFGELVDWIEDLLEEKVKADYVHFDATYAELNAKALSEEKVDYLTMGPSEYPGIPTALPQTNPETISWMPNIYYRGDEAVVK